MRKGIIDLDWFDSEIDAKMRVLNSPLITADGVSFIMKVVPILRDIRSKCTPIQEQTINGYVVTKGEWTNATIEDQKVTEFLSKTCINDWESNKYCSNQNKCQMCKIKQ